VSTCEVRALPMSYYGELKLSLTCSSHRIKRSPATIADRSRGHITFVRRVKSL